jgi:hypothetical protein
MFKGGRMCRKLIGLACLALILVSLLLYERVTASCRGNVGVSAMAFSNDSRYFGATWDLSIIRVWDFQTIQLAPGEMMPSDLVFSPDGKLIVYTYLEIAHLLEFGSGREVRTFP